MANTITWNKFYWWIWWDDYLTSWSQYLYWEDIDVKTNSLYITPSKAVAWTQSITWNANGFITVYSWANKKTYAYTSTWNIVNADTWASVHDFGTLEVVNAVRFNGNVFFIEKVSTWTTVKLKYTTEANLYAWTPSFTTIDTWIDWADLTPPMFSYLNTFLLVWVWKNIFRIDNSLVTDTSTFEFIDNIIGITHTWWNFKFFSWWWDIWFYDLSKNDIVSLVSTNEVMRWVCQYRWIEYIIWWQDEDNTKLYYLNWYRLEDIQKAKSTTYWTRFRLNKQATSYNWEVIFFWEDKVYSFGNKIYWLPKWLSVIHNDAHTITAVWSDWDKLYFWDNNWTVAYISEWNSNKTSWYITLPIFTWGKMNIKKKCESIRCYSWWSVTLSASIDWWAFEDIQALTSWRNVIYYNESFYEIVFNVTFTWDSSFYELELNYNVIEN